MSAKYARTVGIAVDARRRSKSEESVAVNSNRLKDYLSRLVVFSKSKKPTDVPQLTGPLVAAPAKPSAVSFVKLNDEMKAFRAVNALRVARADSRLVGIRKKQAAVEKKDEKEE